MAPQSSPSPPPPPLLPLLCLSRASPAPPHLCAVLRGALLSASYVLFARTGRPNLPLQLEWSSRCGRGRIVPSAALFLEHLLWASLAIPLFFCSRMCSSRCCVSHLSRTSQRCVTTLLHDLFFLEDSRTFYCLDATTTPCLILYGLDATTTPWLISSFFIA